MQTWIVVLITVLAIIGGVTAMLSVWLRRSSLRPNEAASELRALGVDLVRLPGRLRRIAADLRTPRRARWWWIGLAIYIVSPFDLIPDFIPVIGHIDELVAVPFVLRHVQRVIPVEIWAEYFPPR